MASRNGSKDTPVPDHSDKDVEKGEAGDNIQDPPAHGDNKETQPPSPSWSYATKKTVSKGMLNASLLVTNATALKSMFDIAEGDRHTFWIITITFIITSILSQVIASILMFVLSIITPQNHRQLRSVTILNNVVVGFVLFISVINALSAGFGLQIVESE